MWGFILEVFPTSPNRRELKFPIHLNSDKSQELTKTGLPFPHGKAAFGRAGGKAVDFLCPSPAAHEQASAAPSVGSTCLCRTRRRLG